MKTALLQISSSDDPARNLAMVSDMVRDAAAQGAGFVLTPEVTNCVSGSHTHQTEVLQLQSDDITLKGMQSLAQELELWISIGSLGIKTGNADGRFANRSFLIGPDGSIVQSYDKIHMFDVDVSETETYRESASYRPGARAAIASTPFGTIGMSICYDVRFAYLFRALAQAGAEILTVPAAFSPVTGAAHWDSLLRCRAIETGCYVLATAQTGSHETRRGRPRASYGHSMVIAPWGEVLLDAGTQEGVFCVEIDRTEVAQARSRIAALRHDRTFEGP